MTCLFDGRFSPAEEVMERCGGRKAVWCIDTSVVLGMHVSFCLFVFSSFIKQPYWRLPCALFVFFF